MDSLLETLRFVVVHANQLAQQAALTYAKAQTHEAERVAEHIRRVEARRFACAADAEAALADYAGHGQGRRGRRPRPWRYHAVRYRVETCQQRKKRAGRGRPPKAEKPQEEIYYRLGVESAALERAKDEQGWFVLATTVGAEACADTEVLQTYQAQNTTGELGCRWINNPAAITPVWLEKPERIAALAMLTVMGLLVYALIQRQVRLSLRDHGQHLPGNTGATAIPTAAVVLSLFVQVMIVQLDVDKRGSLQVYGLQDHHLMICDALGIDRLWYASPPTGQNRRMSATPP
jgi:transposase